MKTIYNTIILGMCISLGFLGSADAQYSVQGDNIPEVLRSLDLFHCGAPDNLTNNLDTAILVQIGKEGRRFNGLQHSNIPDSTVRDLPKKEKFKLNKKIFRGNQNKPVELIVTIPGIKNSSGNWDLKQVIWNLGDKHEATYTKLNYLGREEGFEIIFVYENGVPDCEHVDEEHFRTHVDGHICDPDDGICS